MANRMQKAATIPLPARNSSDIRLINPDTKKVITEIVTTQLMFFRFVEGESAFDTVIPL